MAVNRLLPDQERQKVPGRVPGLQVHILGILQELVQKSQMVVVQNVEAGTLLPRSRLLWARLLQEVDDPAPLVRFYDPMLVNSLLGTRAVYD